MSCWFGWAVATRLRSTECAFAGEALCIGPGAVPRAVERDRRIRQAAERVSPLNDQHAIWLYNEELVDGTYRRTIRLRDRSDTLHDHCRFFTDGGIEGLTILDDASSEFAYNSIGTA